MSTATSRPEYATLLAKTLPAVIHSEKENEHYTALLTTEHIRKLSRRFHVSPELFF